MLGWLKGLGKHNNQYTQSTVNQPRGLIVCCNWPKMKMHAVARCTLKIYWCVNVTFLTSEVSRPASFADSNKTMNKKINLPKKIRLDVLSRVLLDQTVVNTEYWGCLIFPMSLFLHLQWKPCMSQLVWVYTDAHPDLDADSLWKCMSVKQRLSRCTLTLTLSSNLTVETIS